MDRAALDALEKRVAALRKHVAERAKVARDAKPARPSDAVVASIALGVCALAAFLVGVEAANLAANPACHAIPIRGVATVTVQTFTCATCGVDTVTLDTNGNMTHEQALGSAEQSKVPADEVRDLVELMATSCFFDMRSLYAPSEQPGPFVMTTLTLDGKSKTIHHELGRGGFEAPPMRADACMPPAALRTIEWRVDEIAGKHRRPVTPESRCDMIMSLAQASCAANADAGSACDAADEHPACMQGAWAVMRSEAGGYDVVHVDRYGTINRLSINGRPSIEERLGDLRVTVHRGADPEDPWGERPTAATDTCLLHDFPAPKLLCVRTDASAPPPWLPATLQVPADSEAARASHWLDGNTTRLSREVSIEALPLRLRDANGVTAVLPGPTLYASGPPYDFGQSDMVASDRIDCNLLEPLRRAKPEDMWRRAMCERFEGRTVSSIVSEWRARCAGKRDGVLARACTDEVVAIAETNLARMAAWRAP